MSKNSQSKTPFKVQDDGGGLSPVNQTLKDKLDDIDNVVKAVIVVLLVMVGAMVVATVNMYLDQAHFNNEIYKEQSGQFQTQLNSEQSQINALNKKVNP
jgi:cell division protein FtsL